MKMDVGMNWIIEVIAFGCYEIEKEPFCVILCKMLCVICTLNVCRALFR